MRITLGRSLLGVLALLLMLGSNCVGFDQYEYDLEASKKRAAIKQQAIQNINTSYVNDPLYTEFLAEQEAERLRVLEKKKQRQFVLLSAVLGMFVLLFATRKFVRKKLSSMKMDIYKTKATRIAVVVSIMWGFGSLMISNPFGRYWLGSGSMNKFLIFGILPVFLYWAYYWINLHRGGEDSV